MEVYDELIKALEEIEELKAEIEELNDDIVWWTNRFKAVERDNERLNNIINEFDEWLKEKKEQMERFELYKRKETGAFWYSTMGNIDTFIEKIKELKESDKECLDIIQLKR